MSFLYLERWFIVLIGDTSSSVARGSLDNSGTEEWPQKSGTEQTARSFRAFSGDSKVAVTLTDKAAEQLKSIMKSEVENKNLKAEAALRLMVVGGGCSGFSYKMGFDESIKEDDRAEEIKGVKVIVDEKSSLYLDGVEVDFHDGLMGKGFVFNNPNASGTCGCGESFSV